MVLPTSDDAIPNMRSEAGGVDCKPDDSTRPDFCLWILLSPVTIDAVGLALMGGSGKLGSLSEISSFQVDALEILVAEGLFETSSFLFNALKFLVAEGRVGAFPMPGFPGTDRRMLRPLADDVPAVLPFVDFEAIVERAIESKESGSWCKESELVQRERVGVKRASWCKESELVQSERVGAKRASWCKASELV
jgi:hypothetical protein